MLKTIVCAVTAALLLATGPAMAQDKKPEVKIEDLTPEEKAEREGRKPGIIEPRHNVVVREPIIAALTRQVIEDLWVEYRDELVAMDVGPADRVAALLWDARLSLLTILLAGFGRAAAEVGAVMIVGGNIDGFTRVMTTTIALETSKGNLPLAVGLGLVLISVILAINALAWAVRGWSERHAG